VLVTTEGARDYFIRKYPRVGVEKIVLLPNGFDPEIFYPSANNNVRFQNHEKITFVYSGSLTKRRTPEFFFRALKQLIVEDASVVSRISVKLIGFIHNAHLELVNEIGLQSIVSKVDSMSPKDLSRYLRDEASVFLLFQRADEGGDTAIPGKLYEYLALKKPIICLDDAGGATTKLLTKFGSCLNVSYEDIPGIKSLVRNILDNYADIRCKCNWSDGFCLSII